MRILSGVLRPGEALPTEMELCARENISRHTAREALRLLTDEGLITRRRGTGSVVSQIRPAVFSQPLGDFDSILQYAREVKLSIRQVRPASLAELRRFGLSGHYATLVGQRGLEGQPPVALTTILVLEPYAPSRDLLKQIKGPISEWIEREHACAVEHVEQRMEAVSLSASDAQRLGVCPQTAALRTIRRYTDTRGRPLLLSESLHPAGRFVYEMRLTRLRK